jgi:hypothetical protein
MALFSVFLREKGHIYARIAEFLNHSRMSRKRPMDAILVLSASRGTSQAMLP